ncbi:hypothetical protein DP145_11245 [Clostridium tetani]|uniref:hypothetical protein n=1 Tax=Clostridium tetani TaxID=1513 RepID=UPI00100A2FF7|nr:hypothetical protein [Clostridium tetani]RXI44206.1 hypothetical protein DP126_11990 [Clostridium tetani]RXM59674.1 hypothetical protein DP138_12235 [Clostridium tetani]RXM65127.1 hypothetical protein DP145_11245 [Clostridium tetani]BDR64061.1 hypothetical protein K134307016_09950 [Clostridium tetani]
MEYEFNVLKTKYGSFLEMNFIGESNIDVLSGLFHSSNINIELKDQWINKINKVLKGNSNHEELGFEAYDIDIKKGKTYIFFYYPENGEHEFELSTTKFKEITEIWFSKLEEFRKNNN